MYTHPKLNKNKSLRVHPHAKNVMFVRALKNKLHHSPNYCNKTTNKLQSIHIFFFSCISYQPIHGFRINRHKHNHYSRTKKNKKQKLKKILYFPP